MLGTGGNRSTVHNEILKHHPIPFPPQPSVLLSLSLSLSLYLSVSFAEEFSESFLETDTNFFKWVCASSRLLGFLWGSGGLLWPAGWKPLSQASTLLTSPLITDLSSLLMVQLQPPATSSTYVKSPVCQQFAIAPLAHNAM